MSPRQGNDSLSGDLGDDSLIGGSGIDTMVLSGNRSDYTFDKSNSSLMNDVYGTDIVSGIEEFQFDDGTYTFEELFI